MGITLTRTHTKREKNLVICHFVNRNDYADIFALFSNAAEIILCRCLLILFLLASFLFLMRSSEHLSEKGKKGKSIPVDT